MRRWCIYVRRDNLLSFQGLWIICSILLFSCIVTESFAPKWQFRLQARSPGCQQLFISTTKAELPQEQQQESSNRRKKKNKYEQFSKVVNEEMDPMERMIAEAERKNAELQRLQEEEERNRRQSRPADPIAPLPPINFPNNKDIDPYDPSSFGYVEIGKVLAAHGVHGWLKVRSTTDFSEQRLCSAGIRHLRPMHKRAPRPVILLQGRHRQDDEYLIQLEGIEDRDAATKIRGGMLYIREEQVREENDDDDEDQEEYLVSDLVGLQVFLETPETDVNGDGEVSKPFVGTVNGIVFGEDLSVVPGGVGYDYLELCLPRGATDGLVSFRDELVLIPLVPQIVTQIDLEAREIYLDPPDGLLDLTYVREDKTRVKGFLPLSPSTRSEG